MEPSLAKCCVQKHEDKCLQDKCCALVGGGCMVENNATLVLHLLSLDLPDFQLCLESKMELSVAI